MFGISMFDKVQKCRKQGGLLIDVRSADEFADGHIPGSINIPLARIGDIESVCADRNRYICVYCLSGIRAGKARMKLGKLGYKNVKNIGGIKKYKGKVER